MNRRDALRLLSLAAYKVFTDHTVRSDSRGYERVEINTRGNNFEGFTVWIGGVATTLAEADPADYPMLIVQQNSGTYAQALLIKALEDLLKEAT